MKQKDQSVQKDKICEKNEVFVFNNFFIDIVKKLIEKVLEIFEDVVKKLREIQKKKTK